MTLTKEPYSVMSRTNTIVFWLTTICLMTWRRKNILLIIAANDEQVMSKNLFSARYKVDS